MRTHKLGSSDLVVPICCLGTMTWGEQVGLDPEQPTVSNSHLSCTVFPFIPSSGPVLSFMPTCAPEGVQQSVPA